MQVAAYQRFGFYSWTNHDDNEAILASTDTIDDQMHFHFQHFDARIHNLNEPPTAPPWNDDM